MRNNNKCVKGESCFCGLFLQTQNTSTSNEMKPVQTRIQTRVQTQSLKPVGFRPSPTAKKPKIKLSFTETQKNR